MRRLPIPYTEVMVKSLLQGLKNMTRRTKGLERVNENPDDWEFMYLGENPENPNDGTDYAYFKLFGFTTWMYLKPQFQIGDQLWVKETYCKPVLFDGCEQDYYYKADFPDGIDASPDGKYISKWITGRFMPKAAARIWIEVTDIKCERLLDITQEDANAEGVERWEAPGCNWNRYKDYMGNVSHWCDARTSFISLWQKINGLASVKLNPWVFVYTFKRIDKPDD